MSAHTGELGKLRRYEIERLIREANLGDVDTYICERYLIGKIPHIEIAGELQGRFAVHMDRSTVSRHWSRCKRRLQNIAPTV